MRKLLVAFIVFSLLLSIPAFSQYKGKSLTQVKTIMNAALQLVGVKARILKVAKNRSGKVDFYAKMTTKHFTDELSWMKTMAGVVAVVGDCTRQTSWASSRLYFCNVETNAPTNWMSTRDCRVILRQAESGVSSTALSKAIMSALHKV